MSHLDDATHITNPSISPTVMIHQASALRLGEPVTLDWDAASDAWSANKVRRGLQWAYRCTAIQKNGLHCAKVVYRKNLCKMHSKAKVEVILANP